MSRRKGTALDKSSSPEAKSKTDAFAPALDMKNDTTPLNVDQSTALPAGMTALHRCRFVDWTPEAINSMDMAPVGFRPLLALVRASGDLELRDASQNWSPLHMHTGGTIGRSIEAALWVANTKEASATLTPSDIELANGPINLHQSIIVTGNKQALPLARLFTTGHDGMLVEWDVSRLTPRQHLDLNAGGLWALAGGAGRHLAVACENGTVKIVKFSSKSSQGLELVRTIPVILAEGGNKGEDKERILSLAWSPSSQADQPGQFLAVGTSTGSLIIISWPSGQVIHRIKVDGTAVWTMRFVNEQLLVTGGGLGLVRFWDCLLGATLSSHQTGHKYADVLSLAISFDRTRVFASSSDGRTLVLGSSGDKWVTLETLSMHRHDVRSSTCALIHRGQSAREIFLNAGLSGEVAVKAISGAAFSGKENRTRYLSITSAPPVKMAPVGRLIVGATGPHTLNVWTLGQASTATLGQLGVPGRFLLQVNVPRGETVSSFDISADGSVLGYCTGSAFRLYRLTISREEGEMSEVKDVDLAKIRLTSPLGGSLQLMAISPDGKFLAVVSMDTKRGLSLHLLGIEGSSVGLVTSHHAEATAISAPSAVDHLIFSEDSTRIALADAMGTVYLFTTAKLKLVSSAQLPTRATAIRFIPDARKVLAVTADKRLSIITEDSSILSPSKLPCSWLTHPDIITGIAFAPSPKGKVLDKVRLFSENILVECSLEKLLTEEAPTGKEDAKREKRTRRRRKSSTKPSMAASYAFGTPHMRLHTEYGKILFFDYLPSSPSDPLRREAVLVERPMEHVQLSLPPAQDRKQFGGY